VDVHVADDGRLRQRFRPTTRRSFAVRFRETARSAAVDREQCRHGGGSEWTATIEDRRERRLGRLERRQVRHDVRAAAG